MSKENEVFTDDLVKWLRATCNCNIESTPCMVEEECRAALAAADRIEELEAKLAKDVEALKIDPWFIGYGGWKKHVKDTLAELKGQDDE